MASYGRPHRGRGEGRKMTTTKPPRKKRKYTRRAPWKVSRRQYQNDVVRSGEVEHISVPLKDTFVDIVEEAEKSGRI